MFKLIFTGDTIDDGRVKINERLFTGITANSPWMFINSGITGFSLEMSGITSLSTNNVDTSNSAGNIIIGLNNAINGTDGYNFIQGQNNSILNLKNSFIKGNGNDLAGLSNSFIFGNYNEMLSGNCITISPGSYVVFSSNTLNNNYVSILGSSNSILENQPLSLNPINNFLTILSNSLLKISADTEYLSILPGSGVTISGTVTNSSIAGAKNNIGTNSIGINDNIYIFGSGITPSVSSTTISALSGTYVNDLCIENQLTLNKKFIYQGDISSNNANLDFFISNIFYLIPNSGNITVNDINNFENPSLFFSVCKVTGGTPTISGNPSDFREDYNRWDMPSNVLGANVIFLTNFNSISNKSRYKG